MVEGCEQDSGYLFGFVVVVWGVSLGVGRSQFLLRLFGIIRRRV